jgi:hypothetical protein
MSGQKTNSKIEPKRALCSIFTEREEQSMSHHGTQYRVFADRAESIPEASWRRADQWINGVVFSGDYLEAMAIAREAALNTGHPFIVMGKPRGGLSPNFTTAWRVTGAGYRGCW